MDITAVKPISYMKAHAAAILDDIGKTGQPLGITQHGEVKAVLVGAEEYRHTQETLAFLKLVALGDEDIRAGRSKIADEVVADMRAKIAVYSRK
jgi:prevent-host-death family protein